MVVLEIVSLKYVIPGHSYARSGLLFMLQARHAALQFFQGGVGASSDLFRGLQLESMVDEAFERPLVIVELGRELLGGSLERLRLAIVLEGLRCGLDLYVCSGPKVSPTGAFPNRI